MTLDRILPSLLLGVFVLGSGCGQAYDNFRDDEADLRCELRIACGNEDPVQCSEPGVTHIKDECQRYRPRKANECLTMLEDYLDRIDRGETGLCESKPWAEFEFDACDEVLERKSSRKCEPPPPN